MKQYILKVAQDLEKEIITEDTARTLLLNLFGVSGSLRKTDVCGYFDFRKEAQTQIYKCKESCYGKGTNASNVLEGDYGTWKDWEDVLVKFAKKAIAKNVTNGECSLL